MSRSSSSARPAPTAAGDVRHDHARDNISSPRSTTASRSRSLGSRAPTTSYVPNLTPAYELTDDNYVDEKGNKDPVQVERVDVFSLPTIQRIEVSSRDNQYALDAGRGAGSEPDRNLRPTRRLDHLRRTRSATRFVIGPARRADDPAARALRPDEVHLQTELGILPARSDGHRHPHRREPGLVELSGAHHLDRGGRQGAARLHLRGAGDRRLDAGLLSRTPRPRARSSRTGAFRRSRSTRRSSSSRRRR